MIRRSAQCVIFNNSDKKYYCFFNSKHNKYAPVGGKYEPHETNGIEVLLRETHEELEVEAITKVRELGIHTLKLIDSGISCIVETFIMYVDAISLPKEDFLTLVELDSIPDEKRNKFDSYTSLLSIMRGINGGCKWRCDEDYL